MTAEATAKERRAAIVDLVNQHGFMSVGVLAERFGVTQQTISRDVNALYDEGHLNRYHGGARPALGGRNMGYSARQMLHLEEKRQIASVIAAEIPHGASLILNIGTTTEEVAPALINHRNLRVITNNLHVAQVLSRLGDCEIILAGGLVRNQDGGVVGDATLDMINHFCVDYAVVGISGIGLDGTLLDYDYRKVRVSQAILRNARQVLLAADHSKFGRPAMGRMGTVRDIHPLFTDQSPPKPVSRLLAECGWRCMSLRPWKSPTKDHWQ